jgi:hypothetical protein
VITAATANDDLRAMAEIGPLSEAYGNADTATRQAAVDAILAAIEPYRDSDGWRAPLSLSSPAAPNATGVRFAS